MTKKLSLVVTLAVLSGCQSMKHAEMEAITLPNGNPGLVLDCTAYGWTACFKTAGEACPGGYAIHERSMDENTQSEIPVEPPAAQNTVVPESRHRLPHQEKYMVISCKT